MRALTVESEEWLMKALTSIIDGVPPSATAGIIAVVILLGVGLVLLGRRTGKGRANYVIVDGSNAMYWKDNTPQLDTVRDVLDALHREGFTVGIMFDANAGYLLSDRYLHDGSFEHLLDLPKDHVMVVNKGTPADISILSAARTLNARIVTNDRYREWAADYPEIHDPGYLIRGEYRAGKLHLDFGDLG